jgi:hypothetical protein
MNEYGVELDKIYRKALFFGIIMNIVAPFLYFYVANSIAKSGTRGIPQSAEELKTITIILIIVSIVESVVGFFIKKLFFFKPMIKSQATFKKDFSKNAFSSSIATYAFSHAAAVYGLVLFLLGADLMYVPVFGAFSLIIFFLLRPTYAFFEKSLEKQQQLVKEGKFYKRKMFGGPF